MQLVAGVDAFRAVACKEVHVEAQARNPLKNRYAVFFCGAGVNGGFVNNDIAGFEDLADGLAGFDKGRQIRPFMLVYGRRHGDDEYIRLRQVCWVCGVAQAAGFGQFCAADFKGAVMACLQGQNARLIDVKTYDVAFAAKLNRQGQTNIAKPDDCQCDVFQCPHALPSTDAV